MVVDGIVANRTFPVRVAYKDIPLDITPETEAVRYLGFWATPNGNMQAAMQLVMNRTLRAKRQHRGNEVTWIDWTVTGDRGIKQCGN